MLEGIFLMLLLLSIPGAIIIYRSTNRRETIPTVAGLYGFSALVILVTLVVLTWVG